MSQHAHTHKKKPSIDLRTGIFNKTNNGDKLTSSSFKYCSSGIWKSVVVDASSLNVEYHERKWHDIIWNNLSLMFNMSWLVLRFVLEMNIDWKKNVTICHWSMLCSIVSFSYNNKRKKKLLIKIGSHLTWFIVM